MQDARLDPISFEYNSIFTTLFDYLPDIAANMQNINLDYIQGDVAEYRISRMEDIGGEVKEITYYIYFTKGANGLWKIESY